MKRRQLKGRKKGSKKKGSKKTSATSTAGFNEQQLAAATEAKARLNVEKKEFNKKLNEMMKRRIEEFKQQAGAMDETEKSVAIEKIRLEYQETKKQASKIFKERYAAEIQKIRGN